MLFFQKQVTRKEDMERYSASSGMKGLIIFLGQKSNYVFLAHFKHVSALLTNGNLRCCVTHTDTHTDTHTHTPRSLWLSAQVDSALQYAKHLANRPQNKVVWRGSINHYSAVITRARGRKTHLLCIKAFRSPPRN